MSESNTPESRHPVKGLIPLIQGLGQEAVNEFLRDLEPHLEALDEDSPEALQGLLRYLDECFISATIITDAGGVKEYEATLREAGDGPIDTVETALQKLRDAGLVDIPELEDRASSPDSWGLHTEG